MGKTTGPVFATVTDLRGTAGAAARSAGVYALASATRPKAKVASPLNMLSDDGERVSMTLTTALAAASADGPRLQSKGRTKP